MQWYGILLVNSVRSHRCNIILLLITSGDSYTVTVIFNFMDPVFWQKITVSVIRERKETIC